MGICPPAMFVGNLTNRRSIVDMRDLVRTLWLSAERCKAGEGYNVGDENIYSVQKLIKAIGTQLSVSFKVEQRPELVRAFDELVIAGDNAKFRSCCAWMPEIPLAITLQDMLAWWRARLSDTVLERSLQGMT